MYHFLRRFYKCVCVIQCRIRFKGCTRQCICPYRLLQDELTSKLSAPPNLTARMGKVRPAAHMRLAKYEPWRCQSGHKNSINLGTVFIAT